MGTALRTTLAATGMVAALLAAPAMAQVSQAEQQRIARSLAQQGYDHVEISELDHDVTVLAFRGGAMQSFAYDTGTGRLARVGAGPSGARASVKDRGGDHDDAGYGKDGGDGGYGGGYGEGAAR